MFSSLLFISVIVLLSVIAIPSLISAQSSSALPLVVNTWGGPFVAATDAAYGALIKSPKGNPLDFVELGCSTCEANQCDGSVGFGGSPDEKCETTLDAMIMNGMTMKSGAVASLRRIKDAISVARFVLEYSKHSMLAGDLATEFAKENGFEEESLSTDRSIAACNAWKTANCQPNYRLNVTPDPTTSCGPYIANKSITLNPVISAATNTSPSSTSTSTSTSNHDTISMIVLTADGNMACGTTTNGAGHKIPGRVGDGPIAGSGSYVDAEIGGCGSTGDGDTMMRFLPCLVAVDNMRIGMDPTSAGKDAISRIAIKFPGFTGAVVVVNKTGSIGGASYGPWSFTYAFRGANMNATTVVAVPSMTLEEVKQIRQVADRRTKLMQQALLSMTNAE